MRRASLATALLVCSCALAQQAPSELRGTWTATVGASQTFRGTWTAQASPRSPNLAQGSWTLLSGTDEVVLEGKWSARKTGRGWQGTWTARVLHGGTYSGAWETGGAGLSGKTFADLLTRTVKKEVAGSWRSGRYQGNWWLQGYAPPGRPR